MVELLLSDEDGDSGDNAEEANGGLEGPEAALFHPGHDAAAVRRKKRGKLKAEGPLDMRQQGQV